MGIIGNFRLVGSGELTSLLKHPETIHAVLEGEEVDRLTFRATRKSAEAAISPESHLDVDKAWHGLHFLLTGSPGDTRGPLNFIAAGGEPIGAEDVGHGPARGFKPEQLKQIAKALEAVSVKDLKAAFDPKKLAMGNVYPWQGSEPKAPEELDYLVHHFHALVAFLSKGAQADKALLVYMS